MDDSLAGSRSRLWRSPPGSCRPKGGVVHEAKTASRSWCSPTSGGQLKSRVSVVDRPYVKLVRRGGKKNAAPRSGQEAAQCGSGDPLVLTLKRSISGDLHFLRVVAHPPSTVSALPPSRTVAVTACPTHLALVVVARHPHVACHITHLTRAPDLLPVAVPRPPEGSKETAEGSTKRRAVIHPHPFVATRLLDLFGDSPVVALDPHLLIGVFSDRPAPVLSVFLVTLPA